MDCRFVSRLLGSVLLVVLLHPDLHAQTALQLPEKLTLDDAIRLALQYHPSLRSAEAGIRSSKAILGQTESNLLPSVNLTAGGSRIDGYFVFNPNFPSRKQSYNSYTAAIQAEQVVFDFSKTWSRVSANKSGVEVSEFDFESMRDAVVTNVQLAYFQVIKALRVVDVDSQTVDQAEKHLAQVRAFYQVGKRPQFDVTRGEVDLANARVNLISARNQLQVSNVQLENDMGVQSISDFAVVDTFKIEPFDVPLDSAEQIAVTRHPEILSAQARLLENRAFVAAARSQHLPSLLASGSYSWNGFEFPLQSRWNAGLTLSLPLFQGFGISAQVQQAQANVDESQAAINALTQQILLQVKEYYLGLKEAEQRIGATRQLVDQAAENLRLAEARYDSGVGSAIEITDARTALSNADIVNIQALFDYESALVLLRQAMGTTIHA